MNPALSLALIVLACAAGIAAGWMLHAARTPVTPHIDTSTQPVLVDPDRRLITAMIGVHDLDGGTSIRDRIREDLAQVGVQMLDAPAGAAFDASHHKAVAGATAQSPEQVGTIAALIRPGWSSAATGIIRFTEVAVYVASNDPMPA